MFLGGGCWRLLVVFLNMRTSWDSTQTSINPFITTLYKPIITYMRTSWDSTRTVRSKSRMWQYPNILNVLRPRGMVLKSSWAVERAVEETGGRGREKEGEG